MSKRGFGVSLGIVAAVAVFWFTRAGSEAPDAGFDVLRLPNTITDGAHIADERGFFAKRHIRIDWTGKQLHGPAGIVSLIAGENDAAGSISTAVINALGNHSDGPKLKIIAGGTPSTKAEPLFRYIVKDGSPIGGKPSDFIGKTIVANPTTITWYPLVMFLKRAGLDYHQVKFVSLPSPLASEQALRQGEVDAIAGSENSPPGSKLLAEGGVHFVPGISDFDVLGIAQIGGWVMRDDYIKAHPDVVRRFVAALGEAYSWADDHPSEAREIVNRGNDIPEAFRKYQGTWHKPIRGALVDEDSIRKWIAILEEFEQIKPGAIKPDDVFTNEYNAYATEAHAAR